MTLDIRFTAGAATVDTGSIPLASNVAIPVKVARLASGTESTLVAFTIPVLEGQFDADDIEEVSFDLEGSEISIYAAARGYWRDNSPLGIYVEFETELANGTELNGTLNLTGGHAQPRRSKADTSANFVNDAGDYTSEGFPEGVVYPSSAEHLCAANCIGKIRPEAGEPVFTGSDAVNDNYDSRFTTTVLTQAPIALSSYNGCVALWHKFCRNPTAARLKAVCSFWTKTRTVYLVPSDWSTNEQQGQWENAVFGAIYMGDDVALAGVMTRFELTGYIGSGYNSGGFWDHSQYEVRFQANRVSAHFCSLRLKGRAHTVGGVTLETAAAAWMARVTTAPLRLDAEPYWGGNNLGDVPIAQTARSVLPFQNFLMMQRLHYLMGCLPESATHTTVRAQIDATLNALRTGGAANLSTEGYPQYMYGATNTIPRTWVQPADDNELRNTPDLTGFATWLHAEKAARTASLADANRARALYAVLGYSQGVGGPFLQNLKQFEETFHSSQQTPYYLEEAGI